MSKVNENNDPKALSAVDSALSKTEQFFEKNSKLILMIIAGIAVVVLGIFAFNKFYLQPKEKEAQTQMFFAVDYFEKDSIDLAIKGDSKGNPGFVAIIEDYGMTKAANLAHYYLGSCYMKKGEFEKAIEQFDDFSSDDKILGTLSIGSTADAYMELGKTDKAIDLYVKAADRDPNNFTTPMYLMKAGLAYEDLKNYKKALELYERIKKDYFRSMEARDIEKYIARASNLSNSNS